MDYSLEGTAFVIAHYDDQGRVARYLRDFIAYVRGSGARVLFVSTKLAPVEAASLEGHAQIIVRENVGYDFWSYKIGIDALGIQSLPERLVLLNSSFLILDPQLLCARFFSATPRGDLMGITYCREIALHLQSYWVSFESRRVLQSQAFASWWTDMVPISERQQVVERYEVGMSTHFAQHGFQLASVFRRDRTQKFLALCRIIAINGSLPVPETGLVGLDPEIGDQCNPTAYNWDALVQQFGIVKFELLKKNPMGINTYHLRRALESDPRVWTLTHDALGQ